MAQKFVAKIFFCTFSDDFGGGRLAAYFFLQRPNFLAELAQESWRDLAAVVSESCAGSFLAIVALPETETM